MKVLVTGGAGFIGGHLCALLTARGATVVVLDDLSTGSRAHLGGVPVDLRVGCVTDVEAVESATAGVDAVVHLAAVASVPLSLELPFLTHQVNVTGTVTVLEAARRVGAHVVLASSAAVYGDDPTPLKSESLPPRPRSPYAASKLAAEMYTLNWQRSYHLSTLVFRFFNVFGPRQSPDSAYAAVVPAFVAAALAGEPLRIHGDGHQTRDFVPVSVVARALAEAVAGRVTCPTPVNLALGGRTSLLDLASTLESIVDRPLYLRHEPARAGDIRDSRADNTAFRGLFPDLTPPPLRDTLEETVAWARRDSRPLSASIHA